VGLKPLPNLIKIDVEDSKSEVLKRAEELFDRCRSRVICEVHDAASALFVSEWVKAKGFSLEYIGNRNRFPAHLVAAPQ
jgi:hypothetical protein